MSGENVLAGVRRETDKGTVVVTDGRGGYVDDRGKPVQGPSFVAQGEPRSDSQGNLVGRFAAEEAPAPTRGFVPAGSPVVTTKPAPTSTVISPR